ncbi:HAD family hydrolase [Paracoccus sediminicola]|uniref:HAD family hydrolase n=1 Tax=Paracoccus sediminicola TaxID=3017783 RepID=UPI0022F06768|nr:HAD family phosphatase [Paracoccus sediminicola]WBU56821.1 HAD family phosphatase [Paracoccus sediminicola]
MTAFIFDCDGVLVDSETLSVTELGRSLRLAGARITDAEIFTRMIGRPIAEIVSIVAREHGTDATPFLPEFRTRLAARFEDELRALPGMAEALAKLPGGPKAVASSSTLPRLAQTLKLTGLWDHFAPHVYSATQVARGKPAPDLFLFAAERLGVAPRDCIVIEDSPAGIEAAQAAGMRVVALTGGSHAEASGLEIRVRALSPDAVIAAAEELPETLRGMMTTV